MTAWRIAESLRTFQRQCDTAWPHRSTATDGEIGDAAHSARPSGHNPNSRNVVCAFDLTQDRRSGADCTVITEQLRTSRDRRIVYVIWNRRIFDGASGTQPWTWRTYTGMSPHTDHLHLSVGPDVLPHEGGGNASSYDDAAPWQLPCFGYGDDVVTDADRKAIAAEVVRELLAAPVGTVDNDTDVKPPAKYTLGLLLRAIKHQANANRSLLDQLVRGK